MLLFGAGSAYWIGQRGATDFANPPLVLPFTTYPGSEWDPSLSPDGNLVAFVWGGPENQNRDIYVKQVGSESPRRLTTDPKADFSPVFAPDGQSIAFMRDLAPGKSAVMTIGANGGRERQLAEMSTLRVPDKSRWLSWHPAGHWLAVAIDQDSAEAPAAIYLLSPQSGERRRLTSPTEGLSVAFLGDTNPAFSPDGRNLAFVRVSETDVSEIFLLHLTNGLVPDGEPRQLTFADCYTVTPAWMPDGETIIYASGSHVHSTRLWAIPITGSSKPRLLPLTGQNPLIDPAVSGATRRLIYRSFSLDINIWRNQILWNNEQGVTPARLNASNRVQEAVHYSPDGKASSFLSHASATGRSGFAMPMDRTLSS